ncbi:FRIGIDA-like protein 5 [Vicia villosa]|uniref:FRIGIDA-like protein 5 n=1 Tax=Vicia villosa TaxID=3911 RepID=UPI00273B9495|nr:FRIGIDA-like protein 5 [Vicia villosa]
MDFEASDVREPVFCDDFKPEDGDDVLLLTRISSIASLGTCSNKRDVSLKRKFDDSNSLHIKVKKSKVSTYVDRDKDEDDIHLSDKIIRPCKPADNSFSSLKRDLALLEKLFEEGRRKTGVEEKRLQCIKREIEECCKVLESKKKKVSFVRRMKEAHNKMQGKVEECMQDFVVKEGQLHLMEDLSGERMQELKTKKIELNQVKGKIDKDCGRKEDELKALSQKIAECTLELKAKEKELDAMNKLIGGQAEELESERKKLEGKEREFECQMKELVSKQRHLESRLEELESNEKHFEIRFKELESKERDFEGQVKEMESKKKDFVRRVNELESKENILVGRVKEFESKKKEFELPLKELVKKLESKQKHFNRGMKVLESIEQIEGRVTELESKERKLEDHVKDIKSKEEELDGRVKEFESNKKHFESQFQNFKSKEKQFEGLRKEFELRKNKFKVKVKELNLKEKLFGGQVKYLESEMNKIDRQLKEPELTEKQYEVLTKYIAEEKDSGLQLDSNEKTDGVESLRSGVLVNLLESSDPAKLVLDIILNPTIPLCDKKGDHAVIINDSHINLLEQLMTISPYIKPSVRKEALKLALDLKANVKENTENYLSVLGFLLLLSIYGLVTFFIEDEILEFYASVAHYKIAAKLFKNLGFANKVSDFVENLIKRKQIVGAVRFSCEYNLADKNQLIDLLQEHIRDARQICEISCNNSNSNEIKDKARDREIACLETVLQCISDHGLEHKVLFNKEIKYRILELKGYKGN